MSDLPSLLKQCSACKQQKTPSQFPRNRSKKDGLSTECHECNRKRVREWAKEHPRKVAERKKRYARNNPEKIKRSQRIYVDKKRSKPGTSRLTYPKRTKEDKQAYARAYYQANSSAIRQKVHDWDLAHPDESRQRSHRWYINNKDKAKANKQKRRSVEQKLPHTLTAQNWMRCLDYWHGRCAVCGRPPGLWHTIAQDHWIPVSDQRLGNPGYTPDNIIPLCHALKDGKRGCNNSKHNRDPHEWLTEHFGPRKAKTILKDIQDYFTWVKEQS